jgi:hypothetical protein
MRLVAGLSLVLSLVVAVSAGAVALVWQGDSSSPSSRSDSASPSVPPVLPGRPVHVDTAAVGTTFLPLGAAPVDGHTLSAQRAYNAMLRTPSFSALMPVGVRPYYGLLTHSFTSPVATRVRVWGFAVESSCVYADTSPPRDSTPPAGTRCRKWEFVNARTGHDLGVITQEVLPE